MTVHDDDREEATRPELDALLDTLRQPARPEELTGEQDAVAAMTAALSSSRHEGIAPVPITKHTRKLAAVGVAAALIVGGVTAAAASVLNSGADNRVEIPAEPASSTSSTATSTTTTTTASTTTSVATAPTTAAPTPTSSASSSTSEPETTSSTDDSTTSTSVKCNHGEEVSRVAHETPPGPDHGEVVSAAAHDKTCDDDGSDHGNSDSSHGNSSNGSGNSGHS